MTAVTIGVTTEGDVSARFVAAMNGEYQGSFITFTTVERLFETLTDARWEIILKMTGAGPLSLAELARRVDRDVKCVQDDVDALLNTGVLDHVDNGLVVFPYDTVHVDFTIETRHFDGSRQREDPENR
ncbi:putative transcriptional regulator [Paraburkholderia sp. BL6669N2]|nr:putative transcriptional regulator [Paraburkholderia sp. BL6669N2]